MQEDSLFGSFPWQVTHVFPRSRCAAFRVRWAHPFLSFLCILAPVQSSKDVTYVSGNSRCSKLVDVRNPTLSVTGSHCMRLHS
ncbi:hypothetical protein M758_1G199800 [Ceratodon purpureus]|uniref:Secreted protein n=1 Tax=Ceratodon purpureus TaxID=3225 RepID=A0A8T0JAR6_CERPU|nr:hypothetical protein KC19_1G221000 [Ceratodon purpureus]KAG0630722.1 hypothetical protein M758_1G199800 [Ceratodon purpureus]